MAQQLEGIVGLAVKGVLSQYSGGLASLPSSHVAIYEQHHYEQVPKLGSGDVEVNVARQHFSSLLQGGAFDAILEHVQQGASPAAELSREQFLTITHLVNCALEAAQNSDALWEEPQAPAPSSSQRKRHPTVQEFLGSRMLDGGGSAHRRPVSRASSTVSEQTPSPVKGPLPRRAPSGSKENMREAANTSEGLLRGEGAAGAVKGGQATAPQWERLPSRQPSPVASRRPSPTPKQPSHSKPPASAQRAAALPARGPTTPSVAGTGQPVTLDAAGAVDITDFERKLQDLMRRMQQDQAKLQGKASGSDTIEDSTAASPTAAGPLQAEGEEAASSGKPSPSAAWESFNSSPEAAAALKLEGPSGTSPLAQGAAASSLFGESFAAAGAPAPGGEPAPAPHSAVLTGPAVAEGAVAMGLPVVGTPARSFVTHASVLHEAQLRAAPLAGLPAPGRSAYGSPDVLAQRANHFAAAAGGAAALDPAALSAAMQQLSIQQALAAQLAAAGAGGEVGAHYINPADPAAVAAIARAQAQLEAAAASLVAAATARPALPRSHSALSSLPPAHAQAAQPQVSRQAPFTANDHHAHAGASKLGRYPLTPSAHALGPLGAGEARLQPRPAPSRLSRHSSPSASVDSHSASAPRAGPLTARPASQTERVAVEGAPLTARAAPQSELLELSSWQPMAEEDLHRCEGMFAAKGYETLGGMDKGNAQQLYARLQMAPHLFAQVWAAADVDGDNVLSKQEFCLFMYLLRMAQRGYPVPLKLTRSQAMVLLGLEEMQAAATPEAAAVSPAVAPAAVAGGPSMEQQPPLKVDLSRIRSALGRPQQPELHGSSGSHPQQQGGAQDYYSDSDDDSADSMETRSISSKCSGRHPGMLQQHLHAHLATPSHLRPLGMPSQRCGSGDGVSHAKLSISIGGADIRYSKPLDRPFFNISVHDSLLRTVELPQDTPPGHYRKETHLISLNHAVELQTHLAQIPRGSVVYIELKHYKSSAGRMSTLAWTFIPLEKVVDFGPVLNRVREGPLSLPLYRKPLDLSLRRLVKRKGEELLLTISGVA